LPKLKEIVPSLGTELSGEPTLFEEVWSWGIKVLKLDKPANGVPPAPLSVESGADIPTTGERGTVAAE
jgi:malate dehydrogenase (quinone)